MHQSVIPSCPPPRPSALPVPYQQTQFHDESEWPVVVINPPDVLSDADLCDLMDQFADFVTAKDERYVVVVDLREVSGMPSKQRKLLTERLKQAKEGDEGNVCQGVALVIRSEALRGVLMAILWMFKPSYGTIVFNDLNQAMAYAKGLITND